MDITRLINLKELSNEQLTDLAIAIEFEINCRQDEFNFEEGSDDDLSALDPECEDEEQSGIEWESEQIDCESEQIQAELEEARKALFDEDDNDELDLDDLVLDPIAEMEARYLELKAKADAILAKYPTL